MARPFDTDLSTVVTAGSVSQELLLRVMSWISGHSEVRLGSGTPDNPRWPPFPQTRVVPPAWEAALWYFSDYIQPRIQYQANPKVSCRVTSFR